MYNFLFFAFLVIFRMYLRYVTAIRPKSACIICTRNHIENNTSANQYVRVLENARRNLRFYGRKCASLLVVAMVR